MIFPAHAETQIVVVTGVVTSGNAAERLANESVGLYADKKRTTGELARDVSLGLDPNPSSPKAGTGPWGVYCLICANVDPEVNELWVLADADAVAAHPKLARPIGAISSDIRTAKVGDLVVQPIKDPGLASDLDSAADRIAAVIETEAVRTYLSIFPLETANRRVFDRGSAILELTDKTQWTNLFERVPKNFQKDILENDALHSLVNQLFTSFEVHFI